MSPSSFNGSAGVNPEQWLQEMERYLRVTGVDDSSKVLLASTYLKGGARQSEAVHSSSLNIIKG